MTDTALLTFENIMDAEDITEQDVEVPQWGGKVRTRSLSHRQMRQIKKAAKEGEVDDDFVEQQVMLRGLVSPSLTEEQVEHMWDKNTAAIMLVLNSIMGNSKAKDKAVKEEEKSLPSGTE